MSECEGEAGDIQLAEGQVADVFDAWARGFQCMAEQWGLVAAVLGEAVPRLSETLHRLHAYFADEAARSLLFREEAARHRSHPGPLCIDGHEYRRRRRARVKRRNSR